MSVDEPAIDTEQPGFDGGPLMTQLLTARDVWDVRAVCADILDGQAAGREAGRADGR